MWYPVFYADKGIKYSEVFVIVHKKSHIQSLKTFLILIFVSYIL